MSVKPICSLGGASPVTSIPKTPSSKVQEIALSVLSIDPPLTEDGLESYIIEQVKTLPSSSDSSLVEQVHNFLKEIDISRLRKEIEELCSTLAFGKVCQNIKERFSIPLSRRSTAIIEQLYIKHLIKRVQQTSYPLASSLGCEEILTDCQLAPSTHSRSTLENAIKDLFNEQISLLGIYFDFKIDHRSYQEGVVEHQLAHYGPESKSTLQEAFSAAYDNFFSWVIEHSDKSVDDLPNLPDIPNSSFTPFFLENIEPIYENASIYRECEKRYPLLIEEKSFHLLIQDWRDSDLKPKSSIENFCNNLPVRSRVFVYSTCLEIYKNKFNPSLFEFIYEEVQKLVDPDMEDINNLLTTMEANEYKSYLTHFWNQRCSDNPNPLAPGIFHPSKLLTQIRDQLSQEYAKTEAFLERNTHLSLSDAWNTLKSSLRLITYGKFQDVFLDISEYEKIIKTYINDLPDVAYKGRVIATATREFRESFDKNSPMEGLLFSFLDELKKQLKQTSQAQERSILFDLQIYRRNPLSPITDPILSKKQGDLLKVLDVVRNFLKNPLEPFTVNGFTKERFEYLFYLALVTTLTIDQIINNGKRIRFNYFRLDRSLPTSRLLHDPDIASIKEKTLNYLRSIFSEEFCNELPVQLDILSFFTLLQNRFDKKT